MIKASEVSTRDQERDAEILNLYQYEHKTLDEIGKRFQMTKQSVSYIVCKNKHLLKIDADFEKVKRINRLQRIFDNCGDNLSPKKDVLNVITELRHEIEGEGNKTIINNNSLNVSGHSSEELRGIITALRERVLQSRAA